MSEQTETGLTDTQVEEFATKIAGWMESLPPAERSLFEALLARAVVSPDDVAGHGGGVSGFSLALRGLEAQDRMGNFEIQRLMSQYNQAETLASSVYTKLDQGTRGNAGRIV